jgi:hypothetical protein
MGYIPSSTTQNLHAYLTQVGRYNLLFKKASDFQIKYFSLHDNDVNYIIASENINLDFNKLPKGFVPDITGDDDDCIRSVAQAHIVDANSIIIPGKEFVRSVFVGFEKPTFTVTPTPAPNSVDFTGSINLVLTPPSNGVSITTQESNSTSFVVYVESTQGPINNVKINGKSNQSEVVTFGNSTTNTITFDFSKDTTTVNNPPKLIDSNIILRIKDLQYATLKGGQQSYTHSITLTV